MFYAMLRAIPHKLSGVIVMFASIIILFLVPWLNNPMVRDPKKKIIYTIFFIFFLINNIILS